MIARVPTPREVREAAKDARSVEGVKTLENDVRANIGGDY